jgi:hypothetical protein
MQGKVIEKLLWIFETFEKLRKLEKNRSRKIFGCWNSLLLLCIITSDKKQFILNIKIE